MADKEKLCKYLEGRFVALHDKSAEECKYRFRGTGASPTTDPTGTVYDVEHRYPVCAAARLVLREQYGSKTNDPLTREEVFEKIAEEQKERCDGYETVTQDQAKKERSRGKIKISNMPRIILSSDTKLPNSFPEKEKTFEEMRGKMIYPEDLPVGQSITGFNSLEDLDHLNSMLIYTSQQCTNVGFGKIPSVPERLMPKLKEKGFNGRIGNINVTIVENNLLEPSEKDEESYDLIRYLARIGLFSTGRGQIGELIADIKTYAAVNITDRRPYLGVSIRNLVGKEGLAVLDELFANSKLNWEESQRMALRRKVQAGLPSLGKRR